MDVGDELRSVNGTVERPSATPAASIVLSLHYMSFALI